MALDLFISISYIDLFEPKFLFLLSVSYHFGCCILQPSSYCYHNILIFSTRWVLPIISTTKLPHIKMIYLPIWNRRLVFVFYTTILRPLNYFAYCYYLRRRLYFVSRNFISSLLIASLWWCCWLNSSRFRIKKLSVSPKYAPLIHFLSPFETFVVWLTFNFNCPLGERESIGP